MNKLKKYIAHLRTFTPEKQEGDILQIIGNYQNVIVDMNTNQLMAGIDAAQHRISPPYSSKRYAEFKLFLNPAGVVDLRVTGEFHEGFFISINKFPIEFDSKDKKAADLKKKYGANIFGITSANKKELVRGYLVDDIHAYYRHVVFKL